MLTLVLAGIVAGGVVLLRMAIRTGFELDAGRVDVKVAKFFGEP